MTPGEKLRLFVAVDLPRVQLDAIQAAVDPLRERWAEARWTPVENQHLTLKFLGWVSGGGVRDVEEVCGSAAARHAPERIALADLGSFPSATRVRVLWVGVRDPAGLLAGLAGDLDRSLAARGFEPERRPFTAHLTLARFKSPIRLKDRIELELPPLGPFDVAEIVLYRSHLSSKGPRYEPLRRFPLGPGRTLAAGGESKG